MTMPASDDGRRPAPPRRSGPGYTRFVALMKVFLPTLAAALVLTVVMWSGGPAEDAGFRLGFADSGGGLPTSVEMLSPRYVGRDGEGRTYLVTAERARPVDADVRRIGLTSPQADLSLPEGRWLTVMAGYGLFRQAESSLRLEQGVNVFTDAGYEMTTAAVEVDLAGGSARTDVPVSGQGPVGRLEAERMRIEERGRRLLFDGHVHVTLYPGARG